MAKGKEKAKKRRKKKKRFQKELKRLAKIARCYDRSHEDDDDECD